MDFGKKVSGKRGKRNKLLEIKGVSPSKKLFPKGGFTLLEVLISVIILLFLFVVMENVLGMLGKGDKLLKSKVEGKESHLVSLLYYDLFNAKKIKVVSTSNPSIDILLLRTTNSLYKIPFPYVKWIVKNGVLYRIESPKGWNNPLPFTIDKVASKISTFKLYWKGSHCLIFANKLFFETSIFAPISRVESINLESLLPK